MEIVLATILFVVGIVLIIKCGDAFVDAAIWVSDVTGIPRFIVGATVVSIATTLPEMIVSVIATMQGKAGMAFGNVIGSVACNIGVAMGISLIIMPLLKVKKSVIFKGALMLLSGVVLYLLGRDGTISLVDGLILLGLFIVNIVESIAQPHGSEGTKKHKPQEGEKLRNTIKFVVGITGIIVGAQLLVDNGSILARFLGIPESIIGLTLIAVGTSLPEIITTLTALAKKESALSIGNIFGANIIDMTLAIAVCALFGKGGMEVPIDMITVNIPATIFFIALAVVPLLISKKFSKLQGVIIASSYVGYVALISFVL